MKLYRIYVDASVVGGCLDTEFEADSWRLMEAARLGKVVILVGEILSAELDPAPPDVVAVLGDLPQTAIEKVPTTDEIVALRDAYIAAGIVGPGHLNDAGHVAAATVMKADAIVSWNFRHIVRLDRIRGYNQVNLQRGYGPLTILSPKEVRFDESDEDREEV